jgi:hypothetical protein
MNFLLPVKLKMYAEIFSKLTFDKGGFFIGKNTADLHYQS